MTLTPDQVKAARQMLSWTALDLAVRVGVSERTILAFEDGDRWSPALYLDSIRAALEAAGIEFIASESGGAGVRVRLIITDACQDATLVYANGEARYLTLQEAVVAWASLSEFERSGASVRTFGKKGAVYNAVELDRLWRPANLDPIVTESLNASKDE